jgi:CRP/FNR family transcriptional regulator, cyclic AMP receptor protein
LGVEVNVPSEDVELLAAWRDSYLAALPDAIREQMLEGAFPVWVPAGGPIYTANDPPRMALIRSGLARVFAVSPDGRQATIRYARHGQVVGLPATITGSSPVGAEAVTDSEVSMLNVRVVQRLARTDPQVAWLFAQQVAAIAYETIDVLGGRLFGTVRQSVCRHLLDLAVTEGGALVVTVDVQEVADAIGTVREVVSRSIRGLREDGLIRRDGHRLVISDPQGLHLAALGQPG